MLLYTLKLKKNIEYIYARRPHSIHRTELQIRPFSGPPKCIYKIYSNGEIYQRLCDMTLNYAAIVFIIHTCICSIILFITIFYPVLLQLCPVTIFSVRLGSKVFENFKFRYYIDQHNPSLLNCFFTLTNFLK